MDDNINPKEPEQVTVSHSHAPKPFVHQDESVQINSEHNNASDVFNIGNDTNERTPNTQSANNHQSPAVGNIKPFSQPVSIKIFLTFLVIYGIVLVLTYFSDDYSFVNTMYSLVYLAEIPCSLLVGTLVAKDSINYLADPRPNSLSVLKTPQIILISILLFIFTMPPMSSLVVIAFLLMTYNLKKVEKKQLQNLPKISTFKKIALAVIAFILTGGYTLIVLSIGALYLGVRACDLSGSSKCF